MPTDFTDKHEVELWVFDLTLAAYKLNKARDKQKAALEELAGCDLDGWEDEDMDKYMELALGQGSP